MVQLDELDVSHNRLTDAGLRRISESLFGTRLASSIKVLRLAHNPGLRLRSCASIQSLLDTLTGDESAMTVLDLEAITLDHEAVTQLANGLKKSHLQELNP